MTVQELIDQLEKLKTTVGNTNVVINAGDPTYYCQITGITDTIVNPEDGLTHTTPDNPTAKKAICISID